MSEGQSSLRMSWVFAIEIDRYTFYSARPPFFSLLLKSLNRPQVLYLFPARLLQATSNSVFLYSYIPNVH